MRCANIFLGAVLLLLTAPVHAGKNKVEICHVPPGNPSNAHTIRVSEKAMQAHLAHGDYLGQCNGNSNDRPLADAGTAQAVFVNDSVSLDGTDSSDPDGDPLSYRWTLDIPAGSSAALADADTATPQFTPDIPGEYTATLVVSDGALDSAPDTVAISVSAVPVNMPPVSDAGPDQSVTAGVTVSLDGSGSFDPDGDALAYSWTLTRPAGSGAVLSAANSVSPTFVADLAGSYGATLVVNDGSVDSASDSAVVTVASGGDNAPVITSTPVTAASLNTPYSYDVNATDPDAGETLTYALMQAPAGMAIDSASGFISWTPDSTAPADVDVVVTDSTGQSDRQIYLILVNNGEGDQPPTLAPIPNQSTVVDQAIMATAVGSDPEGEPLRYGLLGAPAGMVINTATGEILWTPTAGQDGNFNATVTARDPGGQQATASFWIAVAVENPNSPPVIDGVTDRTVSPLTSVQILLSASDPDEGDILQFSVTGLPTGAQFSDNAISWTPASADAGTVQITATVTDSAGNTDTTSFAITVTEPQFPPVAVDDAYTIDRSAQLQIAAEGVLANDTDANNDALSAQDTSAPVLGSLDSFPGDGGFNYTPPANPNIEVGLREQCRSPQVPGSAIRPMPIIGDVDADGAPEIVSYVGGFTNYLFIMDGNCNVEANHALNYQTYGVFSNSTQPALVNLDADPELEIVVVRNGPPELGINRARLVALNPDGSLVWTQLENGASEAITDAVPNSGNYYAGRPPTVIDLDGDGTPEILMNLIFDNVAVLGHLSMVVAYNTDGTVRWEYTGVRQEGDSDSKPLYVADLDLDGSVEIINHTNVIDHNGNLEFVLQSDTEVNSFPTHLTVAIANFDTDPFPELVGRDAEHLYLFEHTGGAPTLRLPLQNGARSEITVAELDGDPLPEFAFHTGFGTGANASWLTAFDTDGSVLWTHEGTDYDGAAVSLNNGDSATAFDFDQDGIDELLIALRTNGAGSRLFMFRGSDGAELAAFNAAAGGAYVGGPMQFPSVADIDGDGAAEVIYTDAGTLTDDPIVVLEGLDGNAFPPARPIRHQRTYQPTDVNPDGSLPLYPAPHWLIPGLNKFHAAPVLPFEDPGASDFFRYVANDGTADSNEATVDIAITNVNAPTIVSRPLLGASPDFDYEYGLLATDGDFGDQFTWTLVDAPAAMSVDGFGIIRWTPIEADLGPNRVHVVVTDLQGNSDEQSFLVNVSPPIPVPDVVGGSETDAATALEDAGLAVGKVTTAFSLTVPAGEVISQSIPGGQTSPAGAFINFVVSLGPQPIYVPNVVGVTQPVAQAAFESVTLSVGTVTLANSDTVPPGVIVSQSVAANSEVSVNTSIDLTISSGPVLAITLQSNFMGGGDSLPYALAFFDTSGSLIAAPGDLAVSLIASDGASGPLPTVSATAIAAAVDTRGAYQLRVIAPSLGVDHSEDILVAASFAADGAQASYGALSAQMNRLIPVYEALTRAIIENDLPAVAALGADLAAERALMDLEELQYTPAAAPESGFLPDSPPGAPSSSDAAAPQFIESVRSQMAQISIFLNDLNGAVARNDDLRNRALNGALAAKTALLQPEILTRRGTVAFSSELYRLLSLQIPGLMVAEMDALLAALGDAGLLASYVSPAAFYAQTAEFGADALRERPSFFTLVGLSSASAIRTRIIKNLYVPIIKKIGFNLQNLAVDGLLKPTLDAQDLPGVITAASLSFHQFTQGNSVIESTTASPVAGANIVLFIGPTLLADLSGALSGLNVSFSSVKAVNDAIKSVRNTAKSAQDVLNKNLAIVTADQSVNGCVFSNLSCRQLGLSSGVPSVYTQGTFPAPVLMVQYNAATGAFSTGNFLFYSKPAMVQP